MLRRIRSLAIVLTVLGALVLSLGFTGHGGPMAVADPAVRASFTWIGDNYDNWSNVDSWSATGCGTPPCYPRTTSDDAIFNSAFIVTLDGSYTIDDLTVDDAYTSDFDANGTARTLTCDTVVISGDNYGEFGGTRVVNLAGIETN